jgi:hypothetical protein
MNDINDDSLFETTKSSLFAIPFKPLANDKEINIFNEPLFKKQIKAKPVFESSIEDKLSHDELLRLEIKKSKEYEEEQRLKRWKQINKQKEKENNTIANQKRIKNNKINKEFEKQHQESGSNKNYKRCYKCQLFMYINETNFNKLKKTSDDYKRGWRYEEVCISCKNEKTEYKHEKYADKIKFEYEDFKCGCGETFKINKDKRECYKEIERHEKSRFHKLYKMVNDYKNHLTTTIDFKLFSIGQLRAINTYKLNVKEDLKYIITNIK